MGPQLSDRLPRHQSDQGAALSDAPHEALEQPLAWWQSRFGETPPRGHLLRRAFSAHWVRFHSLPESRRHARSAEEYAELQRRHLAVASALFTAGEPLCVFRAHAGERRLRGKARHQIAGRQFREAVVVLPIERHSGDEDDDRMHVRALVTRWKPDFFETAVRLLADWHEVGIAFVSPATGNIFCPYDGGMDVFAFSIAPQALGERFDSWRSVRPDGL